MPRITFAVSRRIPNTSWNTRTKSGAERNESTLAKVLVTSPTATVPAATALVIAAATASITSPTVVGAPKRTASIARTHVTKSGAGGTRPARCESSR